MKQNILLICAVAAALSLTGCRSDSTEAENEALRQQVEQLEQKLSDLEQQMDARAGSETSEEQISRNEAGTTPAPAGDSTEGTAPAQEADPSSSLATTHSLEELTTMVDAYEEKVNAAVPTGTASEDMEQFMNLKQEEKSIDHDLDLHEDELEYLYRSGSLSREEYKSLDRELERLEDRLDAAEDLLEYTFNMDD